MQEQEQEQVHLGSEEVEGRVESPSLEARAARGERRTCDLRRPDICKDQGSGPGARNR